MSDRRAYEAELLGEVVQLFSPRPIASHVHVGLSDEAVANEHHAAKIVCGAVSKFKDDAAQFRADITKAKELTDIRSDALNSLLATIDNFLAGVDDETPNAESWSEAISAGRRGY